MVRRQGNQDEMNNEVLADHRRRRRRRPRADHFFTFWFRKVISIGQLDITIFSASFPRNRMAFLSFGSFLWFNKK